MSSHSAKTVILKLHLLDATAKQKAIEAVSCLQGVDSISVNMKYQELTVIGNIDRVDVVIELRKLYTTYILGSLPYFDYKAAEIGSSSVDCAVCLDNFKRGDKCRLLPNCRHSFHVQCIDSWLLKTPICPISRTCVNLPKIDEILRE